MRHLSALFLAVAVLAVGGCTPADPAAAMIGSYNGELVVPDSRKDDPMIKMAQSMIGALTLQLRADKTFLLNMGGPVEGKWSLEAGIVKLQTEKVMNLTLAEAKAQAEKAKAMPAEIEDLEKPMEFVSENGVLRLKDGGAEQGDLVFRKTTGASPPN